MKRFQITTVSLNTTALDFSGNWELHRDVLENPDYDSSSVIVFPELSLSGYGCEDAFYRPWVWEKSIESLIKLLPLTKNRLVLVGMPLFLSPYLYNCTVAIQDGLIRAILPKKNLANTGIHYEKRWFTEWKDGVREATINIPELSLHTESGLWIGDILLDWDGLRIGVEVCEDSWVLNRPSHELGDMGVDLILSPGASHFAFGKYETRSRIFQESSRAQCNIFAFANLMGNETGRSIFDGGNLITANGEILGIGKRLALGKIHCLRVNVDLEEVRSQRVRNFRRSTQTRDKVSSYEEMFLPGSPYKNELIPSRAYETIPLTDRYDEFTQAQILGLHDYLIKSGTKGYTLSLSGGADSSALAILVRLVEEQAVRDFGVDYWISRGFSQPILTTIYQKTENNSTTTQEIAKKLAEELGADHHEIAIDQEVSLMVDRISQTLGRKLNWREDDIALQNIQARVRSPLVWLLANTKNHLLLSTGNRSEASVGYTTMDGDSSGSIAPIAGISKKFLLEWLHTIRSNGDRRLPPLTAVEWLLETRPSAELKPLSEEQEDEKDLMPYSILQKIEYLGIYLGKRKQEILVELIQTYDGYSPVQLSLMVDRFFHLFRISQWKRERLAISFHLDEYGLDPKSSYRFPVLSGLGEA